MNYHLEEKTKYCILFDRITLIGSTLKYSFALAVEEDYWILHAYLDTDTGEEIVLFKR